MGLVEPLRITIRPQGAKFNVNDKIMIKQHFFAIIFLPVWGIFLYHHTLDFPFFFDDIRVIVDNHAIRLDQLTPKSLHGKVKELGHNRTVAKLSFSLNYYFSGYDRRAYRLTNVVIHVLNGCMVYAIVFLILKINRRDVAVSTGRLSNREGAVAKPGLAVTTAFVTALFWTVHPVQIQSVTYIVQRMVSLAAFFYLGSLCLYLAGRMIRSPMFRWLCFIASCLSWLLALGCKEIAITLPVTVFFIEWYFFQKLDRRWLVQRLKYFSLPLLLSPLVICFYLGLDPIEKIFSQYTRQGHDFTPWERVLTQFRVVIFYLSLLLYPLPDRFNLDHDFLPSSSVLIPVSTILSLFVLLTLAGLIFFFARRNRLVSFAILWFFLHLAIESSFLGLAMAFEHRLYLPSFGILLGATVIVFDQFRSRYTMIPVIGALIIASVCTYKRNKVWRDDLSLWADCVRKSPLKERPHNNLGIALKNQGRLDEAVDAYRESIRINPEYAEAHLNLGTVRYNQRRYDEAEVHYLNAIRFNFRYAKGYNNLGTVYYQQGKFGQAVTCYKRAIKLKYDYVDAYRNLGSAFYSLGKIADAIQYYSKAAAINPYYAAARTNLGIVYLNQGKLEESMNHFTAALRIKPDDKEAKAYLKLAMSRK